MGYGYCDGLPVKVGHYFLQKLYPKFGYIRKVQYLYIVNKKNKSIMKSEIKTLIKSWVKDNQAFIDENYCTVEEYLLDQFDEDTDNAVYDWFTYDEIDRFEQDELRDKVVYFLKNNLHGDVTASEYLEFWS